MLREHTYFHLQQVDPDTGEFLILHLLLEEANPGEGFTLANGTNHFPDNDYKEHWACLRTGVHEALADADIFDATVIVAGLIFLDVDSPPSLYRRIAYKCTEMALLNPQVAYTESGDQQAINRYKERNRIMLAGWNME